MGRDGKPYKVVKFAIDITRQKTENADREGQVSAIRKSQAVIEFTPDGVILEANDKFLTALGYTLDEIKGRHHGMFVEPAYRDSVEYAKFWASLKRGEYQAAQYKRTGKGGREIWIQASYNPIFDPAGRPYKVVKFATDITEQVQLLDKLRRMIDENFSDIDKAVNLAVTESGIRRSRPPGRPPATCRRRRRHRRNWRRRSPRSPRPWRSLVSRPTVPSSRPPRPATSPNVCRMPRSP